MNEPNGITEQAYSEPLCISEFLRFRHGEIVEEWERVVKTLPIARALDRPALLDHIPKLLLQVADLIEATEAGAITENPLDATYTHAIERLDEGYDLSAVVKEYTLLRKCIFTLIERDRQGTRSRPSDLAILNEAIDQAVTTAVSRFAQARHRTLAALDRVSEVALASGDLDTFLPKLLKVVLETTLAVDTVAVLLREGDHLRVRATVGLEDEIATGFVLRIGEGFSGKVAAEGTPVLLRDGSASPLLVSPALRARGLKVLYGVPLRHEGQVIGVAHMGSRTAPDFSEQDKAILRTMAGRATALIVQHQLIEEVRVTGERHRLAIEAGKIGTFDWDLASGEHRWSDRMRAIFDVPEDASLTGLLETFYDRLAPEDREPTRARIAAARDPSGSGDYTNEYRVRRRDGSFAWIAARGLVTFEGEGAHRRAVRMTGTVVDITSQKQAEEERERLLADLRKAVEARDSFIAVLSHDLRNPINAIGLGAGLLLKSLPADPSVRRRVESIQKAATRAGRMIDDLLDEVALDQGKVRFRIEAALASTLVADAVETFEPSAQEHGLSLTQQAEPEFRASCDPSYIARVLGNLIGNAIKFTPAGGAITVRAEAAPGEVRFSVSDTGPGVPEAERARLFDRGFKGATEGNASVKGLGLGLAIARRIVEAHRGRIGLESAIGHGSCFWFTLPRA